MGRKPTVLLLTQSFPYGAGEQFLVKEVCMWSRRDDVRLVIAPTYPSGEPRAVQPTVEVDLTLADAVGRRRSLLDRVAGVLRAVLRPLFLQEIWWQVRHSVLSSQNLVSAIGSVNSFYRELPVLRRLVDNHRATIIYSYWNTVTAYAATAIPREMDLKAVVSRFHGYDLYEERTNGGHHCLKRFFLPNFQALYCLSPAAVRYVKETYGDVDTQVSPLGISIANSTPSHERERPFHILSCSFCAPVKRVERIADVISYWSRERPDLSLRWTHIGGGELFEQLQRHTALCLDGLDNVNYTLTGTVSNDEIQQFYSEQNVSVFINLSESEGVPVTILEAMSFGTPVIAPEIGGISSVVEDAVNGRLLSSNPSVAEAAEALDWIANLPDDAYGELRSRARDTACERFDSEKLYPEFIDSVLSLVARS